MDGNKSAKEFVENRHIAITEKIAELAGGNSLMSKQLLSLQSQIDCLRAEKINPERSMALIFSMMEDRLEAMANLSKQTHELSQEVNELIQKLTNP
jgi:hypothetical protein